MEWTSPATRSSALDDEQRRSGGMCLAVARGHGLVSREHYNADTLESRMKFVILFMLVIVADCSVRPTLEQLEDDAMTTGDWTAVERREELIKERLEVSGPGCPPGLNKYCAEGPGCPWGIDINCVEEQSGIQCYCLPSTDVRKEAERPLKNLKDM